MHEWQQGSERKEEEESEREKEKEEERETLHNYVDDPYELGTRCWTRSADGYFNTSNH